MLTEERHRLILELLAQKEIVKLQELVEATGSSESTIRRDLTQLEKEKSCAACTVEQPCCNKNVKS